jgi:hypothetical protein
MALNSLAIKKTWDRRGREAEKAMKMEAEMGVTQPQLPTFLNCQTLGEERTDTTLELLEKV